GDASSKRADSPSFSSHGKSGTVPLFGGLSLALRWGEQLLALLADRAFDDRLEEAERGRQFDRQQHLALLDVDVPDQRLAERGDRHLEPVLARPSGIDLRHPAGDALGHAMAVLAQPAARSLAAERMRNSDFHQCSCLSRSGSRLSWSSGSGEGSDSGSPAAP